MLRERSWWLAGRCAWGFIALEFGSRSGLSLASVELVLRHTMHELGAIRGAVLWRFAGLRGTWGRCSGVASSGQRPTHSRWGPGAVASALFELLLSSPLGDAGSSALHEEFAWCARASSVCMGALRGWGEQGRSVGLIASDGDWDWQVLVATGEGISVCSAWGRRVHALELVNAGSSRSLALLPEGGQTQCVHAPCGGVSFPWGGPVWFGSGR